MRTSCGCVTTSYPSTSAVPPSGRCTVARMRTAVVFPAPLGPSSPKIVPSGISKSMPARASTSPNRLVKAVTRTAVVGMTSMFAPRSEDANRRGAVPFLWKERSRDPLRRLALRLMPGSGSSAIEQLRHRRDRERRWIDRLELVGHDGERHRRVLAGTGRIRRHDRRTRRVARRIEHDLAAAIRLPELGGDEVGTAFL